MTITYPRPMLAVPLENVSFYLQPMVNVSPLLGGGLPSTDVGPALWRGSWLTTTLTPTQAGQLRAWANSLRSVKTFYGFDWFRQYPLLYVGGFGALGFGGTGVYTSSPDADHVTIGSVTNGLTMSPGDFVSWPLSGRKQLHMVLETAVAAGGSITLTITPKFRGADVSAVVDFVSPAAEMALLPDTYAETITAPNLVVISFEAQQVL